MVTFLQRTFILLVYAHVGRKQDIAVDKPLNVALWFDLIKEDIVSDLISSFSTVISLASRLREISKNIEDAEFKNLVADLSLELADAKMKIAALISENAEMKEMVHALTSASGEVCPKCNNRTFELISTRPHPTFGRLGCKERQYKCSGCGFSEAKMVNS